MFNHKIMSSITVRYKPPKYIVDKMSENELKTINKVHKFFIDIRSLILDLEKRHMIKN